MAGDAEEHRHERSVVKGDWESRKSIASPREHPSDEVDDDERRKESGTVISETIASTRAGNSNRTRGSIHARVISYVVELVQQARHYPPHGPCMIYDDFHTKNVSNATNRQS
jgi:hypothetical protein